MWDKKKYDTKFLIQFLRKLWMKNSIRKSIYFHTLYFYTNHSWKYIILLVSAFLILYLSIVINSLILVTNHITYSFANQIKQSTCYDYFFFELLRKINQFFSIDGQGNTSFYDLDFFYFRSFVCTYNDQRCNNTISADRNQEILFFSLILFLSFVRARVHIFSLSLSLFLSFGKIKHPFPQFLYYIFPNFLRIMQSE